MRRQVAGVLIAAPLIILFGLLILAALIALALWVVMALWAWTVPDLFPGAVEQGLIAAEISWFTSFKLVLTLAVFGAVALLGRGGGSSSS